MELTTSRIHIPRRKSDPGMESMDIGAAHIAAGRRFALARIHQRLVQ
ncbi:hypothetical protein [Rosistilla oblonga]